MGSQPPTLLSVVVYWISSDINNHLILSSFTTCKTGPLGNGDAAVERVFESVAAVALSGKRIAVVTTDNGNSNVIKGMRDGGVGRWPCAAAHMLNRMIKITTKRVNNSVNLLPKGL